MAKNKTTKATKKLGRSYKNGKGPTCGNCKQIGHYRKTCGRTETQAAQ